MSMNARQELTETVAPRYRAANQAAKARILDEFTASTGYHRKYAIALLNQADASEAADEPTGQPGSDKPAADDAGSTKALSLVPPIRPGRRRHYTDDVKRALLKLWDAAGRICSKRLVPFLPQLIEVMERHGHLSLSAETRKRLLAISPATVDRLLAETRKAGKARGRSTTLPGSLLKHLVSIRTFSEWDDLRPGFVEADLVAHCGTSMAGSFLHTMTMTDIATGWTECLALLYRDQDTVLRALRVGQERLPFPLLGLDTDNGSEFLNYLLLGYCEREEITFTRSRAFKKNDPGHVEQKNGAVVRRFVGYDRFEGIAACRALAELYQAMRLYVNFFQPSMKLVSRERQGSKIVKKYDQAQTPYQRVLASAAVSDEAKEALRRQFEELDPLVLLADLERLQEGFWRHAYVPARELDASEGSPRRETASASGLVVAVRPSAVAAVAVPTGGDGAGEPAAARSSASVTEARDRSVCMYRRTKRKRAPHRVKHTWRTRPDPFAEVWPALEERLRRYPHLEAKTLFRELQARHPGRFKEGQLRTLQRRVKAWRLQQAALVAEEIGLLLSQDGGDRGDLSEVAVHADQGREEVQDGTPPGVHTTCTGKHWAITYTVTMSTRAWS